MAGAASLTGPRWPVSPRCSAMSRPSLQCGGCCCRWVRQRSMRSARHARSRRARAWRAGVAPERVILDFEQRRSRLTPRSGGRWPLQGRLQGRLSSAVGQLGPRGTRRHPAPRQYGRGQRRGSPERARARAGAVPCERAGWRESTRALTPRAGVMNSPSPAGRCASVLARQRLGRRCAKRSSPLPEDAWEPATGPEGKPRDAPG
jgi:hypothetical protein